MRRAEAKNADSVRALTRAAYAKWVPMIGREPKPMTADYTHAVSQHLIDLYEEQGVLVALVEMIPQPGYLLIENLAVDPAHQGKGLGAWLLAHAENTARQLALPEVQLYTNEAFETNITFYAAKGYAVFLSTPIAGGGTMVSMKKCL